MTKIDIYRSFEQWKNGNVLEHGMPRTEYYSEQELSLVEMGWKYGYDAGRAVEQALDKKAENARELGLGWWNPVHRCGDYFVEGVGMSKETEAQKKQCCYGGIAHDCHVGVGCRIAERLTTTPQAQPAREPLTDEQPVSSADELPKGFIPLQQENGTIVYAACLDRNARHYKWLMWKHPDGQWVSKRKLEEWEVMQAEDQEHYGIILGTAAHGITKGT